MTTNSSQNKSAIRQALLDSMRETFVLGVEELSKTMSHMLSASKKDLSGNQISVQMQQREQQIADERV